MNKRAYSILIFIALGICLKIAPFSTVVKECAAEEKIAAPVFSWMEKKESPLLPLKKKFSLEDLSMQEKRVFYSEVQQVFLEKAPYVLDPASIKESLIRLNERGSRGVSAIFDALQEMPQTEAEGKHRIAYVDYLKYRMRWDPETKEKIKIWILDGAENEAKENKTIAMILADKTELLEGLAREDPDLAQDILASLEPSLLYAFGSQEVLGGKE